MKERAAGYVRPRGRDGHADQAVNREQLLGKQVVFRQIGGSSNQRNILIGTP
jgi:hypothetical protein